MLADSGIRRMRMLSLSLLATGLLSAGVAFAEPCAKPADVTAFDVAGLKSKLMVTAITCSQQDRYNDFVQRFRGELMAQERALHAYFVAYPAAGRNTHTTTTLPASPTPNPKMVSDRGRCSASRTSACSPRSRP
jgi:hypothetical protein